MNRKVLAFAFLPAITLLAMAACEFAPAPPTPTIIPSPTLRATLPAATSAPIPGSQHTNFTFAVCGDNRDGDAMYKRLLEMVVADRAAFLVNTGDLVPRGYDFYWENFAGLMEGFPIPFFPVAGNHDLHDGALEGFVKWTPNGQPHYSFDWGQLHFTVANDSLGGMSESELAWIDADLSATKQPVKLVAHHHPAWDPDGGDHIMQGGNAAYLALLKKHGVRYDLCGHDHRYRTAERDGTTLITTGGAGAPLYYPPEQGGFHHYVRFTVRGTDVRFEAVKVEQP